MLPENVELLLEFFFEEQSFSIQLLQWKTHISHLARTKVYNSLKKINKRGYLI